jgi:hypothetical protein
MSLSSEYITAIEQRLAWLKWCQTGEGQRVWTQLGFEAAIPAYHHVLETADTFYMAPHFARLVGHARQSVPDELAYDPTWLIAPSGWLWLPEPFKCPTLEQAPSKPGYENVGPLVRAVGWRPIPPGTKVRSGLDSTVGEYTPTIAVPDTTQFLCFQDFSDFADERQKGFGCWSYFMLQPGHTLGSRIELFESKQVHGRYVPLADRRTHPLHEMRWIFAALYLMAQRLATTVRHETDRATRRRAERQQQQAPPFIRVVTLRRLEEARPKNPTPAEVDWQWQWEVRGHWRNQFFPSENAHRPVYIEAYVKGPEDKPLKPGSHKLFAAKR